MAMFPVTSFAEYNQSDYRQKADEIANLIQECKDNDINVQYEEIDSNILNVYADRIQNEFVGNLDTSITDFQASELDGLYNSAKANLEGYLNGTKTPKPEVYEYQSGDKLKTSGKSVLNPDGIQYFSVGFGHFNNINYMDEFDSYGYDTIQLEIVPESVLKVPGALPCWGGSADYCSVQSDTAVSGNALHIKADSQNTSANARRIYQRVRMLPSMKYTLSFKIKGEGTINYTTAQWTHDGSVTATSEWKTVTQQITNNASDYAMDLEFVYNGIVDVYIDDISLVPVSGGEDVVFNGDFDLDTTYGAPFYSDASYTDAARKMLHKAESTNQKICVLVNPLIWPESIRNAYPEAFDSSTGTMILTNETAKKLVENYIRSAATVLSGFSSIESICLTNESYYCTLKYPDAYTSAFREYLQSVHGNIDTLNDRYGKFLGIFNQYSSFSDISMPSEGGVPSGGSTSSDTISLSDKLFYDWKNFNDKTFTAWHTFAANIVKDAFPGVPVHTKALSYMTDVDWDGGSRALHLLGGANAELFDEFSDWTGNDGGAYVEESGYRSLENVMKWYDYLNSISNKPIYNSEDHITIDKGTTFNSSQAVFTSGSIWQGAIHGKDLSSIWSWSNTVDTSSVLYGHLYLRPSAISAVAKTKLDLNRLAYEVSAIANKQPDVGILYSDTSRMYSAAYMNAVDIVYNGAIKSGNKVGFFSEKTEQAKINKFPTIIVPRALYVEKAVLDKLNAYVNAGGNLIIVGDSSLKKDEYGKDHDSASVSALYAKATMVDATKSSKSQLSAPTVESMQTLLKTDLTVGDSDGNMLTDVEWQSARYRQGRIISVYNYDKTNSKNIVISDCGEQFDNVRELISGTSVNGIYTLEPMGHALFYAYNNSNLNNEIKALYGTRENGVNKLSWEPMYETENQYYIFRVDECGNLNFISQTSDTSFSETADSATYFVKIKIADKLTEGKYATCEDTKGITFERSSEQIGNCLEVRVSAVNSANYSSSAKFTVTAYNEDNTFAGAKEMDVILPANKTTNFEFSFNVVGSGSIKVGE